MKKTVLVLAALATLAACKNSGSGEGANGKDSTKTETKAAEPAQPSIVGKWHLADAKFKDKLPPNQTPESIKKSMQDEDMNYEFMSNGMLRATSKGRADSSQTYTMANNKLITKNTKTGKTDTVNIVSLTDKELQINMVEDMIMIFERVQ
jgi:hypothetical protein